MNYILAGAIGAFCMVYAQSETRFWRGTFLGLALVTTAHLAQALIGAPK